MRRRIPFYWRIEAEPRLFCHRLDPATSTYALDLELAPGEKVDLTEPWSLTVDMAEAVAGGAPRPDGGDPAASAQPVTDGKATCTG